MKYIAALLPCLLIVTASQLCRANMASPISGGTQHGMAMSSRDVTVLHEWILVKPERGFTAARFDVTYEIETSVDGQQIPLLFITRNYLGDFQVSVDGKSVSLLNVPD